MGNGIKSTCETFTGSLKDQQMQKKDEMHHTIHSICRSWLRSETFSLHIRTYWQQRFFFAHSSLQSD